jgi:calcineurin-like phosphoesterase family protein
MSNLYSTKKKIALAHEVIENFNGNKKITISNHEAMFAKLHKIEKKYQKFRSYDLSDFAISLSELPEKHFRLMRSIGWLNHETEAPQKYIDGLYSDSFCSKCGFTQIQHYITVDAYVNLLLIELEMISLYRK